MGRVFYYRTSRSQGWILFDKNEIVLGISLNSIGLDWILYDVCDSNIDDITDLAIEERGDFYECINIKCSDLVWVKLEDISE